MRITSTPARVLALGAALAVVSAGAALIGSDVWRGATGALVSVLAAVAVASRVRRASGTARTAYALLLAGFVMLTVNEVLSLATALAGAAPWSPSVASSALVGASYLTILASATLATGPTVRADRGGTLDALTFAVSLTSIVWLTVLGPALESAGAPVSERAYTYIVTIMLSWAAGIVVALRASGAVPAAARPVLALFVVAIACAGAGDALALVLGGHPAAPGLVDATERLAYVAAWAAVAHPAAHLAFEPGPPHPHALSNRRIVALAAVLLPTPLVAAVREATGGFVDWLNVAMTLVIVIVLVLLRVSQLATEQRHAAAALRVLADHDDLTGLPNRRATHRHLTAVAERLGAGRLAGAAVCYVDLDGFKEVNDTLGHAEGDRLLVTVASRLARVARTLDGGFAGRLGGDEFIVVLEASTAGAAEAATAPIREVLAAPVELAGQPSCVSASLGLTWAEGGRAHTADSLLTDADRRMYAAKRLARG